MRAAALVALALAAPPAVAADGSPDGERPLLRHMERALTGDDSQWRAPNPDYREGDDRPAEFGLRFRMEPDGRHVTGELTGRFEDGREVVYWSLLSFYNPVTERVIVRQIGWDGTLLRGETQVQAGERQVVDMTMYAASGAMRRTRHELHFVDADLHTADAYERGPDGEWRRLARWTWRRYLTTGAERVGTGAASSSTPSGLAPWVDHLLGGSGRWRADNPAWRPGGEAPRRYGMNYRWGPNGQHVIAEIVSLYADGRRQRESSLYITHNPVTGVATLEQTGRAGVYFRGEMSAGPGGEHIESGLVYLPNGTARSVRDENVMLDPDTRVGRVYERDAGGGWKRVREWTWKRE